MSRLTDTHCLEFQRDLPRDVAGHWQEVDDGEPPGANVIKLFSFVADDEAL